VFVSSCLARSSLTTLNTNCCIQFSVAVLGSLPGLCLETDLILASGLRIEANPFTQDKNTWLSANSQASAQKHFCTSPLPQCCNFTPLEHLFLKSSQNNNSSTFPHAKVLQLFLILKSVGK